MSRRKAELDRFEVAKILENFLQGSGSPWEWDDFALGMSFRNPTLEAIRQRCIGLGNEFPPASPNSYCGEEGLMVLQCYIRELRKPS
jgi:hypothetical protein